MPSKRKRKAWEETFQNQVRSLGPNTGLTVLSMRGQVQLKRRRKALPIESVVLPFNWNEADVGNAYVRVRNIFVLLTQGHSLKAAADVAKGKVSNANKNWKSIIGNFAEQKLNHGRTTSQETFKKQYLPVIEMAAELLSKRTAPTNTKDLIDLCVKDWLPGSVTRKHRARALAQFLIHAVEREGFPDIWLPPSNLKNHIGEPNPKQVTNNEGDPFDNDQQILNLITSIPIDNGYPRDQIAARRWVDALKLLSELGLRPVELLYLKVRKDPTTGQPFWWCNYQKKAGGGTTDPRRVFPLPLINLDGEAQQWNLIDRWQAGLIELPSCRENKMGEACNTYLKRRESWVSLRQVMKDTQDKNIVPYSFRHSYCLRAHIAGIDAGSVAMSMGHSLEAHLRAYPWASKASTAAAFARANEKITK